MPTPAPMSVKACPACTGVMRVHPASRATGRVVGGCTSCGTHSLLNPPDAPEVTELYEFDRTNYESWSNSKRHETLDRAYATTLTRISELTRSGGQELFDVGAGAGDFLLKARQHGFAAHGNELAVGAIELTKERVGVDLIHGDLSAIDGTDLFDAVTMWCVIAHVSEPDALLTDAYRILKPGGVLFLQTPRWSMMDKAAMATARATRGRVSRLLDRRVSEFHMTLVSGQGLSAQARRNGFDVVEVNPRSRYSLNTLEYLKSLGVPQRVGAKAVKAIDLAVDRDLCFRNVFDLYARKPLAHG